MALAVLIAAIWGVSFIAIKAGVAEAPRCSSPRCASSLRLFRPSVRPPAEGEALDLAGYGLCIGVGQFGLLFAAIKFGMPAGLASLVIQMQALFTIGLAHFVLGQKARRAQIVRRPRRARRASRSIGFRPRRHRRRWRRFSPCSARRLSGACGNLFSIRAGRTNMLAFIVWSSLFAPLPLLLLSLALEDHAAIVARLLHPTLAVWGGAAFLAYVATIVGFGLWSLLLSRHPAAQVAPFSLLVPVFGIAAAALVYHEPLGGGAAARGRRGDGGTGDHGVLAQGGDLTLCLNHVLRQD